MIIFCVDLIFEKINLLKGLKDYRYEDEEGRYWKFNLIFILY